MILLNLFSCMNEESEKVTEALKISTWVMDKNFEDTGYWISDDSIRQNGYWVSNESDDQIPNDDVFKFETLQLNEVRVMAPLCYMKMPNLNILFEFDGIIELESEDPNDKRIQLAYNYDSPTEPKIDFETMAFGKVRAKAPINFNIYPLGKDINQTGIIDRDTIVDQEYYLNINAYKHDGTLLITAKLKLVVLEDKEYLPEQYSKLYSNIDASSEERSRFLSIELILYEYSDIYKLEG